MMEIKFRAWRVVPNEECCKMIYSNKFLTLASFFKKMIDDNEAVYKLMLYIGLKDCEGKEIFEGDIVDVKGVGFGSIVFMDKATTNPEYGYVKILPAFLIKWCDGSENCSFIYKDKDLKVIGNICENPELLECEFN